MWGPMCPSYWGGGECLYRGRLSVARATGLGGVEI